MAIIIKELLLCSLLFLMTNNIRCQINREMYNVNDEDVPMPYRFNYKNSDESGTTTYRQEESDRDGVVRGSYGYMDANGLFRQVDYVADDGGFRAAIRTNEPGTSDKDSADATIESGSDGRMTDTDTVRIRGNSMDRIREDLQRPRNAVERGRILQSMYVKRTTPTFTSVKESKNGPSNGITWPSKNPDDALLRRPVVTDGTNLTEINNFRNPKIVNGSVYEINPSPVQEDVLNRRADEIYAPKSVRFPDPLGRITENEVNSPSVPRQMDPFDVVRTANVITKPNPIPSYGSTSVADRLNLALTEYEPRKDEKIDDRQWIDDTRAEEQKIERLQKAMDIWTLANLMRGYPRKQSDRLQRYRK